MSRKIPGSKPAEVGESPGEAEGRALERLAMEAIGAKLRTLRKNLKMSQPDVTWRAEKTSGVKIHTTGLSRAELGRQLLSPLQALALARVFGVDVEWLIDPIRPADSPAPPGGVPAEYAAAWAILRALGPEEGLRRLAGAPKK